MKMESKKSKHQSSDAQSRISSQSAGEKKSLGQNEADSDINEEADLVCKKCGNVTIKEEEEWVCPHCQGEIDFFGDNEE